MLHVNEYSCIRVDIFFQQGRVWTLLMQTDTVCGLQASWEVSGVFSWAHSALSELRDFELELRLAHLYNLCSAPKQMKPTLMFALGLISLIDVSIHLLVGHAQECLQ